MGNIAFLLNCIVNMGMSLFFCTLHKESILYSEWVCKSLFFTHTHTHTHTRTHTHTHNTFFTIVVDCVFLILAMVW